MPGRSEAPPACTWCEAVLRGRRRNARYCSGACRAAASRSRAAEPSRPFWTRVGDVKRSQGAQKRTNIHSDTTHD